LTFSDCCINAEQTFNTVINSSLNGRKVSFQSQDNCNSHSLIQPKARVIAHQEMVRQKAEINAAIISLKTNLVLGVSIILIYFSSMVTSRDFSIIITTFLKGLIPIVTAISNFVKIQDFLKLYLHKYNPFNFLN
jgi:hypothetical protein